MTRLQTWQEEGFIARIPPEINCTLFLVGFYLGVSLLLTHLSWYGIPPAPPGWIAESHRMLMKMCIFLILVAAIALVAPGSAHRRLFAACAFPLLALLAMVVHDVSLPLVNSAAVFTHFPLGALLQAIALGSVVALVVSLPVAVLFRGSTVAIDVCCLRWRRAKRWRRAVMSIRRAATLASPVPQAVFVPEDDYNVTALRFREDKINSPSDVNLLETRGQRLVRTVVCQESELCRSS
jgi:hypothetical protein